MPTRVLAILMLFATFISACSRCDAPPSATSVVEPPDAGPAVPYLPARSAPDDSPAPVAEVEAVLFSLRPGLNMCYRAAARAHPNVEGKALFSVVIGGNGRVTSVKLAAPSKLDADLIMCVSSILQGAVFKPTPDGGVASVTVPIAFQPPPPGSDSGMQTMGVDAGQRDVSPR